MRRLLATLLFGMTAAKVMVDINLQGLNSVESDPSELDDYAAAVETDHHLTGKGRV